MSAGLEQIRLSFNLTQREVAEKAEISRVHYTQIENGKRTPSVSVAKRLAAVLSIEWTFFYTN